MQSLFDKEVSVHVLNVGLLENTTMGKFFLTTLLAVAEMERNTIIERTQAGKAIAKQRDDFWEGRPKIYHKSTTYHALSMLEERDENGNKKYTVKKVAQIMKMSESTLYRAARKRKAKKIKQQ